MTSSASQIRIGPDFFAKIKNDYCNWHWALVREFAQNSIDARGSNTISFTIEKIPNGTRLICENNGEPMTHEVLTNKLLTLGGSGKNFEGSVGGFGVAKSLLYYCHRNYEILTGKYQVTGSGAQYEIKDATNFNGTKSIIELDGDYRKELIEQVKTLAFYAQWGGTLTLNQEPIATNSIKGSYRRSFDWGHVYTSKRAKHKLVVRIGGIPMFTEWCSLDRLVTIELTGASDEVLQSSRDALKYTQAREFQMFLQQLAVDKRSALQQKRSEITVYEGDLLGQKSRRDVISVMMDEIIDPIVEEKAAAKQSIPVSQVETGRDFGGISIIVEKRERLRSMLGHEFIIMNNLGMQIPNYYEPGTFSTYSTKLVRYWTRILLQLWEMREHDTPFSVGFVFDTDCEAMHKKENGKHIFFINPIKVVEQNASKSRSLKARWSFTPEGKWKLFADAVHEYAHFLGHSQHDEDFAAQLTDLLGWSTYNRDKFNKCFR